MIAVQVSYNDECFFLMLSVADLEAVSSIRGRKCSTRPVHCPKNKL